MSNREIDQDRHDTPVPTCAVCQKTYSRIPGIFRPVRMCHCIVPQKATEYFALNMQETEKAHNLIQQAKKAIQAAGHHTSCGFSGCTCGAVETFKIESSEFWRQIQALEARPTPEEGQTK